MAIDPDTEDRLRRSTPKDFDRRESRGLLSTEDAPYSYLSFEVTPAGEYPEAFGDGNARLEYGSPGEMTDEFFSRAWIGGLGGDVGDSPGSP